MTVIHIIYDLYYTFEYRYSYCRRQMIVREGNYLVTSARPLHADAAGKKRGVPSFREFCRHVLDTTEKWLSSPHLPPPDQRWMPVTFMCAPCIFNYDIIR